MARILVHVVTGPENTTRATLALLVARTAAPEHEVKVFLAGDAVHFARDATAAAAHGVGTGSAAEHLEALRAAGVEIFLSGLSSKAREIEPPDWAQAVKPEKLVELAVWSDTALVY